MESHPTVLVSNEGVALFLSQAHFGYEKRSFCSYQCSYQFIKNHYNVCLVICQVCFGRFEYLLPENSPILRLAPHASACITTRQTSDETK